MLKRLLSAVLPLATLVLLPVLFRQQQPAPAPDADLLVVISPHTETIRYEYVHAFAAWYRARTGRDVKIDWRNPGGTSDITRQINDRYRSAFRQHWQAAHGDAAWTDEVAGAFNDRGLDPDDAQASETARAARRDFLQSDVGIGIDVFFGGGQYDHDVQARMGHLVDAGVATAHPDWFAPEVIPPSYSGEIFYDPQYRYLPGALSAFGICYNIDRVQSLGLEPPQRWTDLGDPRYHNTLGVADPTKSGSITKCFEMLIQSCLHAAVDSATAEAGGGPLSDEAKMAALAAGWADAMTLIKRIGGNSRYFTDSASKIPRDVASGDLAAGMCIDFYGRGQADFTAYQSGGTERLVYVSPKGGTSISVDPIAMLRGAPNREAAMLFLEFVMSPEGQVLWNYRVGTPGGPTKYALRRLPVRRDLYTPEHRAHMSDAAIDPYKEAEDFVYEWRWTARYFGLIRQHIRCMVLDSSVELKAAWDAIVAAGGPDAVPEAMAAFEGLAFTYPEAGAANDALRTDGSSESVLRQLETLRGWSDYYRAQYRLAEDLAKQGR